MEPVASVARVAPVRRGPHPAPARAGNADPSSEPPAAGSHPRDASRGEGPPAAPWLAAWTPAADVIVALVALSVCVVLVEGVERPRDLTQFLSLRVSLRNVVLVGALLAWASTMLRVTGAYDLVRSPTPRDLVANTLAACTIGAAPGVLLPSLARSGRLGAALVALLWAGLVLGIAAVRLVARLTFASRRGPPAHIMIAGTGPRARALWHDLQRAPTTRYQLVAHTDTVEALREADLCGATGVAIDSLAEFMMHTVVDEVFVALPVRSCYDEIEAVLRVCETAGVHSRFLADPIAPKVARPRPDVSGAFPAVAMDVVVDDWRLVVKRAVDVAGAAAGLLVLAPLLGALALAVRCTGGPGPVLFSQERYGMRKRRFRMYKFRTMVQNAEHLQAALESQNEAGGPVFKMARDPRVTRLGAVLRRTSLDELPQLWNVLRGDMSLVGPRPLPLRDVQRFDAPWLMRRFSVRPGLTCLWQVSGRSNVGFDEWVALDLQYIDRWSLGLDCEILARTVPAVLAARGAR